MDLTPHQEMIIALISLGGIIGAFAPLINRKIYAFFERKKNQPEKTPEQTRESKQDLMNKLL